MMKSILFYLKTNKLINISVIIPTLNSAKFINETLNSVWDQTYKNYEIVVVDGGSTDETIEILKRHKKKHANFNFFIYKKIKGPASARFYGIKKSKGKYIAFLDSDDIWKKNKLYKQLSFMKKNNYDFTYTYFNSNLKSKKFNYIKKSFSFTSFLYFRGIANSTVIVKKTVFENLNYISYPDKLAEDYYLWLLIMKKGIRAYLIPFCGTFYRTEQVSRSSAFIKNYLAIFFYLTKHFKLNFIIVISCMIFYPLNVILRRLIYKFVIWYEK